MTALTLVMTTAGLGRFTAAQVQDDIDLTIASVAFTASDFVAAPTLTALPGEFRRIGAISGEAIGGNMVHMIVRDDGDVGYTVRGFGLFLADGTLFAVYGQATPICEKSASTSLLMPIDIAFPTTAIDKLTFGDANFLNPPATTERRGVVELATQGEAAAGTDTSRVASVAVLKGLLGTLETRLTNAVADLATSFGQALDGIVARTIYGSGLVKGGGNLSANRTLTVDAASAAQLRAGVQADVVATPAALAVAGVIYLIEAKADGPSRYRRFSDGSVEMMGVSALPGSESSFTLNFPWPFPTVCEGIFATIINTAASNDGQSTVQEISLSAASAQLYAQNHKTPTADANGGFRWFARGH